MSGCASGDVHADKHNSTPSHELWSSADVVRSQTKHGQNDDQAHLDEQGQFVWICGYNRYQKDDQVIAHETLIMPTSNGRNGDGDDGTSKVDTTKYQAFLIQFSQSSQ